MFKRIVIVLAVAAAAAAAILAGVFVWFERPGERQIAEMPDPASINLDAVKVAQAYRIERAGRKIHDGKAINRDLQTDPENEQLKRVKLVLDKGWDKEALTEQLSLAVKARDIEKVKALLAKGANVNVYDKRGELPLETAAEKGSMELVRLLLDSGADLKIKNRSGSPALDAAFTGAMLYGHEEVARYFLNMGANVNAVSHEWTALQHAVSCSPDVVKMLLEKGANVNRKGSDGGTPLMAAAYRGRVETTRLLLDNGADVNAKDDTGETSLMKVVARLESFRDATSADRINNCLEVVKLLLERGADVNVNVTDKQMGSRTALLRFSAAGFPEAVKLLLGKGAEVNATLKDGSNALFWAMEGYLDHYPLRGLQSLERWSEAKKVLNARRSETARFLITHGIDVNANLKADGSTALTWAAFLGDAELAKLLLDKGAEVDARLTDGRTPLVCAVTSILGFEIPKKLSSWSGIHARKQSAPELETSFGSRQIDVAKLLLDRKADVNAKLADGATALMWASILGQAGMVKLLLERGADANAKLPDGSTALQWAALHEHSEVVKLLTEHGGGGKLAAAAMSGLRHEVQRLLDEGADVNAKDVRGTTALMECARGGDLETARLLLVRGANVQAKDERGWTALYEALWKDHLGVAALLLDKGTNPNAVDALGWTPLIQAAWKGQPEAVALLLASGADIRAKDFYGKTAFMRAVEMGHRDVAALLLDIGAEVNAAEADGWTPVMAAVTRQDREMAKFLRERGAGMTVAAAVLLGDEREMQRLVKEGAKNGAQITDAPMALLIAARNGREDMVKHLLDRCPDIDVKESCGDTALLFAIEKKYSGITEALLEKGANVNAADDWRRTALHYAVGNGDLKLVRTLLEKGANVNAKTIGWDGAPLLGAVENADVEIVKALLEKGASLHAGVESGDLKRAADKSGSKKVLELLKAHGLKQPNETEPSSEDDH